MDNQRIGILGGTFDPPHNGHLRLAVAAADACGLDRLLLIPTGNPHFKQDQQVTPAEVRTEMTRLMAACDPRLEVDTREVEREGVTYTVDTLAELGEENPGAELLFVIGGDCAEHIMRWKNADVLATQCTVVAVARKGYDLQAAREAVEASGMGFALECVEADVPDISSTQVRAAAAAGEDLTDLVPAAVAEYIAEHGLYARTR